VRRLHRAAIARLAGLVGRHRRLALCGGSEPAWGDDTVSRSQPDDKAHKSTTERRGVCLKSTSSEQEKEHQCPHEQRPQQQGSDGEKVKVAEVLVGRHGPLPTCLRCPNGNSAPKQPAFKRKFEEADGERVPLQAS